jgi:hypothetical protein
MYTSYILKDVVDEMKLSIHPSVSSSIPSSIHGWHHIIILSNVKPYILKDVVDEMKLSIHPSVPSSIPSSIHGWHHIIILSNVKAEKLAVH